MCVYVCDCSLKNLASSVGIATCTYTCSVFKLINLFIIIMIPVSGATLDEWKERMKDFIIDYNALKIEETKAKGLYCIN